MAETISQYQITTFTSPVNGTTPIDANTVRGNDNSIRTSHNAHDADPGIHVQSSVLASRPAAGTAGRKWLTTDGLRIYYDTGSAWSEAAYLPLVGGTVTGATTFSAAVTMSSTLAVTGAITATGGVTGALTGNASTATALATARTLWGQSFDGTGNVSGALTGVTTITASGAINGQTITTTANFTGSVTVANGLTVSAGTSALQAITGTTLALSGAATLPTIYGPADADLLIGLTGSGAPPAIKFANQYGIVASISGSTLTMAAGTALAAQAITGTTLALSGGVTGATGRFGSSTSNGYILGAVVGASADADVFLAGMEGVTNGISYRRVAGAFEFRVATGNVIIADGTLSAQAITGTTLTLTGLLLTAASALGGAGFRLPHGAAPTAPVDGDVWTTTAGMFVRINGVTKTVTLT